MGYYTDYSLEVSMYRNDGKYESVSEELADLIDAEIQKIGVLDEYSSSRDQWWANAKWYDCEDDMILLSKRFPNVLFYLHGAGEDQEDMWDEYFLNGRYQFCRAEIVYDDFDIKKLETPDSYAEKYSSQEE